MWTLRVADEDGETGNRQFRLTPGAIKTLGRAPRADFVLNRESVSRLHCRLTVTPSGDLEVEDLGSTNGTFLNGNPVKRAPLAPGDRLRVGRIELQVTRSEASTA